MAKFDDNDFVDISSSAEREKVYHSSASSTQRSAPVKKRRSGLGGRVAVLILSILFLFAGSGMVLYYEMLDTLNFENLPDQPATNAQGETTTVSVESDGTSLLSSENVLNILLFGQDNRQGENDNGRSDTTILCSIDTLHEKIKLTSFQRDTYVSIPGYGDDKINAAYSWGGVALSIQTIEANFGIKVDKYAVVDFKSFRSVIDGMGGIDIDLKLEEIKYINAQIDVNNQTDRTSFLDYDPNKEVQTVHLDGYQALWYARDRGEENLGGNPEYSFNGDDWDRTSRQRNLIETVVKSLREEASLTDLVGMVNTVGPMITTNLKKSDITFLVSNMMTYINYDIEQMSLPTEGNWEYGRTSNGQSVIVITNWDQVRQDLANFIYEDAVSVTKSSSTSSVPAA